MAWFAFVRDGEVLATVFAVADPDGDAPGEWEPVTVTARPADTATTTWEPIVELVDGTPKVAWTERPFTRDELDAATRRLLEQAIPTLRQWAAEADTAVVTATNAVQVLGIITVRLGVFFARFADLLALELAHPTDDPSPLEAP